MLRFESIETASCQWEEGRLKRTLPSNIHRGDYTWQARKNATIKWEEKHLFGPWEERNKGDRAERNPGSRSARSEKGRSDKAGGQ
jgi:hypothetical protein